MYLLLFFHYRIHSAMLGLGMDLIGHIKSDSALFTRIFKRAETFKFSFFNKAKQLIKLFFRLSRKTCYYSRSDVYVGNALTQFFMTDSIFSLVSRLFIRLSISLLICCIGISIYLHTLSLLRISSIKPSVILSG